MKKSLVVFLLAGALVILWCSSLFAQWQPDVRLSNNGSVSYTSFNNAWCVAASGDTVHVVWWDSRSGNYEIFYKRSLNNGSTWGAETTLTNDPNSSAFPSVAASGSKVHLVWTDYRPPDKTQRIYYKHSLNNGTYWPPNDTPISYDTLTSSARCPSVAVSGSTVHVVWEDLRDGNGSEVYYSRGLYDGSSWGSEVRLSHAPNLSSYPAVAVSGDTVHVVWMDMRDGSHYEVYYARSLNNGATWDPEIFLSTINDGFNSGEPCVAVSGSTVYVVWVDNKDGDYELHYRRSPNSGATWASETRLTYHFGPDHNPSIRAFGSGVHVAWLGGDWGVSYKRSTDYGVTWSPNTRLTTTTGILYPSVSASGTTAHVVWTDNRDGNYEIYYKRRLGAGGFDGFLTEPSQGRHLFRDPARGTLHMVMKSEQKDSVYYLRSTNNGDSWSVPCSLGAGKYPTVGLVQLPWMTWPPFMVVSVAYLSPDGSQLLYQWNDGTSDPGTGTWHADTISPIGGQDLGAPSLVTGGAEYTGQGVFVAYAAKVYSVRHLFCNRFLYSDPGNAVVEPIDETSNNPNQPCLAVDGNGAVYAAWQRADSNQIWYAPRGGFLLPPWDRSTWIRVDQTTDSSQHPFVECYGDSVYVAWSDGQPAPSDVWRVRKKLTAQQWLDWYNVSQSSNLVSESPTQAWREFTTWSDSSSGAQSQSDIWYYSPYWGRVDSQANTSTWSYWPHSQMSYPSGGGAYLWSAWTESPIRNQPPYTVLTKRSYFAPPPPPGGGDSFSGYYSVQAGQDTPSVYCRKRDGVMRFAGKAVDFARDSLVYVLPYLDPQYDYYLRVSSYREAGSNWAQALSVGDSLIRSVQLRSNQVDTAWIKIPPKAYQRDRKVVFSLKNVRGDYVTSLGLMLYQRDPKRGNGGGQSAGLADLPLREVFEVSPNPTKGDVQVEYSLRTPGKVDLSIYNVVGRLVKRVVNDRQPAGVYRAAWDGRDQAGRPSGCGVYFLRLNTPERVKTKRLVVVR